MDERRTHRSEEDVSIRQSGGLPATEGSPPETRALRRRIRILSACKRAVAHAASEAELLRSIVRGLMHLGGYALVRVDLVEPGRRVRPTATWHTTEGFSERPASWLSDAAGEAPSVRAVLECVPCVVQDVEAETSWPTWREEARRRGYASAAALPLMNGESCLGALELYAVSRGMFRAGELALLADVAADLASGLAALRTRVELQHMRERIAHLTRVLKMQGAINSAVLRIADRKELLQEACRIATHVGGYEHAVIYLLDAERREARLGFESVRASGWQAPRRIGVSLGDEPDTSLTGRALRTGEVAVCGDLTLTEPPVLTRAELLAHGLRSAVALPLTVDGLRVGAVTLLSKELQASLRSDELNLLKEIAASVSIALRTQQHAETAAYLAFYDPLTGLAKRAHFCTRLEELLRRRFGPEENPAVAAFDINNLSDINDSFGREVGDRLLQQVAERLKRFAGLERSVAYVGGGTFLLIEPAPSTSDDGITALLDASVFANPFIVDGQRLRVSCRSGVARYPADGEDASALVHKAEAALKRAKSTGERYVHYRLEMHDEMVDRLALEHRLREAIDEEQFELYYQPQVDAASGRIGSVEALLRWNDPLNGLTPAGRFLPVLESSGLIIPVGQWVVQRAVRDAARWQHLGLPPIRISVNVSALQIRRRSFIEWVLSHAQKWPPDPQGWGIDLEITETALLQDLVSTERSLRELRAAGVRVALDDFGTGYCSLGLLSKLPVDVLKIDRSFIAGLPNDPTSVMLTQCILSLASAFALSTVAEGVETQEQLEAVRALGCHLAQGYLQGPPRPAAAIERLLAEP